MEYTQISWVGFPSGKDKKWKLFSVKFLTLHLLRLRFLGKTLFAVDVCIFLVASKRADLRLLQNEKTARPKTKTWLFTAFDILHVKGNSRTIRTSLCYAWKTKHSNLYARHLEESVNPCSCELDFGNNYFTEIFLT